MRNTKKIILISIIVVVLLIGGVFAYTYFLTDTFLSKKDRFAKYISKNSEMIEMLNDRDVKEYYKKKMTDAHKNNTEISFDFSEIGENDEQAKMLNNVKVLFDGNTDITNGYQDQTITAKYSDTELISGTLVNNGDFLGFKVNGILGKYIGIRNEKLQEFARSLGVSDVSNIPDKIEVNSLNTENIINQDETKTLKDKYLKAISECITDDMISEEKYDNGMIYKLTINETKGKEIATKVIGLLQEDDIIISKIKEIATSYAKLSSEETEQLISQYKSNLNQLQASINQTTESSEDTLDIKVYVSKRNLVKTEILFANELQVVAINNNNKCNIEIYNDNEKSLGIEIEKNKNESDLTYNISIINLNDGKNEEILNVNAKYTGLTSASSVTSEYNIKISEELFGSSILKRAQVSRSNSSSTQEKEKITLVMTELITKQLEDTYVNGKEFVIDEKAIQEKLTNMTVTKNADGTYKVVSNETGNTYTVQSNGNVEQDTTNTVQSNEATESEESSKHFSINYSNTITFGEITKVELNDSNKYPLNNKKREEIEKLFEQLGEKITTSVTNKMGTMVYAGAADTLDKTKDNLKEQEKLAFNTNFTIYEGNKIKGTNVKVLVQTVISSNASEKSSSSNRFISITFPVNDGNQVTIDEKNSKYTGLINNSKDYTVKIEYKDGYVNKITVTQN